MASTVSPTPTPTPTNYDYSTDPFLASDRAGSLATLQGREHSIEERRRNALLAYGSRAMAMKVLGLGADDPFIQSIDENEATGTGTLARLAHAYKENQRGTSNSMGSHNLFYSTTHGKALADLAYNNNNDVDAAARGIQGDLEGLNTEHLNAQESYRGTNTAAEQNAYQRSLAFATQYPQSPSLDTSLAALIPGLRPKKRKKR